MKPPREDHARAECYAVISDLFYGRADAAFLKHLVQAPKRTVYEPTAWELEALDHDPRPSAFTIAFQNLQNTCRTLGEDSIRQEYEALFLGGHEAVSPFTSGYAAPDAPDRHLHALRDYLVSCGLARGGSALRFADHVSAVCDVMRWLIERRRPVDEQLAFFDEFVRKSLGAFCDAVARRRGAAFYRAVAAFSHAFIEQELVTLEQARSAEFQRA